LIKTTPDYLIITKPAGLIVHPGHNVYEETLTDLLVKKFPEISVVGEDKTRPGIVHRLDRDVSGLLIIARTQAMFQHLKNAFQNHEIKKEYLALVNGELSQDAGKIEFTINRSKTRGLMVASSKATLGRPAETEFEVIKKFKNYTLVRLRPKTGRTHQIRVHLKAIGHSIVGDQVYKTRKLKEKIQLDRIFLHADTLGFFDLEKNWQEFKSDLPNELKNILKNL
jgi:23S rRNA pseudouridine1911/1915/1917 synthase